MKFITKFLNFYHLFVKNNLILFPAKLFNNDNKFIICINNSFVSRDLIRLGNSLFQYNDFIRFKN